MIRNESRHGLQDNPFTFSFLFSNANAYQFQRPTIPWKNFKYSRNYKNTVKIMA
jgi:hypothetical protein